MTRHTIRQAQPTVHLPATPDLLRARRITATCSAIDALATIVGDDGEATEDRIAAAHALVSVCAFQVQYGDAEASGVGEHRGSVRLDDHEALVHMRLAQIEEENEPPRVVNTVGSGIPGSFADRVQEAVSRAARARDTHTEAALREGLSGPQIEALRELAEAAHAGRLSHAVALEIARLAAPHAAERAADIIGSPF